MSEWGAAWRIRRVSVLFSEPKIPQPPVLRVYRPAARSFSALQRAENSSTQFVGSVAGMSRPFQCSSASRKFLNTLGVRWSPRGLVFQCSSASRKFLNFRRDRRRIGADASFSALQRAENSSTRVARRNAISTAKFQCSSASRKFLNPWFATTVPYCVDVSVLFSEPKIPQTPWSAAAYS